MSGKQECEFLRIEGAWDRCYFIPAGDGERCGCEDEFGKPGGNLPVKYERDVSDLDKDGDTKEDIRWRYVVIGWRCEVDGDTCREKQFLNRGWTNEVYS